MRILVVTNLFPTVSTPWGGTFLTRRIEALERMGHQVETWAIVPQRTGAARLVGLIRGGSKAGHGARAVGPYRQLLVPMSSSAYLRAWLGGHPRRAIRRAAAQLSGLIDVGSFDLVVAHGMYMVPAGSVAEALSPAQGYAVACHGSDVNRLMPGRASPYSRTLDGARARIFVSSALASRARELGMTASDVAVIPNGVDLERFHPDRRESARAAFGIAPEAKVISFVGSFAPVKGADRLPGIVRAVHAQAPHVVCLLAGAGPLVDQIGRQLPIGDVRLLGRLDSTGVADVMAATDVLMLPSRSEGWPSVIFEAFASGVSVVGSAVGGIPEAIADGGVVVAEGAEFELRFAEAVLAVLERRREPSRLRAKALDHGWDAVVASELAEFTGKGRRDG